MFKLYEIKRTTSDLAALIVYPSLPFWHTLLKIEHDLHLVWPLCSKAQVICIEHVGDPHVARACECSFYTLDNRMINIK